jgi:hypothetical protein
LRAAAAAILKLTLLSKNRYILDVKTGPTLERMVLRVCLDQALERRRVREAFRDARLNVDHCLFKVCTASFRFPKVPFTSVL